MGRSSIRIYPDARFVRWVHNFNGLGRGPLPRGTVEAWRTATEVFFGATQQMIHVDSGDLLGSGKMEIEDETHESVTAAVTYGGGRKSDAKPWWKHQEIDYAKYELGRGGSHDFFARAAQKTHKRLQQGAGNALVKMMEAEEW
jgi:hypothetical protein